jgi:hypothetical protein
MATPRSMTPSQGTIGKKSLGKKSAGIIPRGISQIGPVSVLRKKARNIKNRAGMIFHFPNRKNGMDNIIDTPIIWRKLKYI